MKKYWLKISKAINARTKQERIIFCCIISVLSINFWLLLVEDKVNLEQLNLVKEINAIERKLEAEKTRFKELQIMTNTDPNLETKKRITELQQSTISLDKSLDTLYNSLILPQEMAIVLNQILQEKTNLKLLSLENLPSKKLISADLNTAIPLVGGANTELISGEDEDRGIKVYKHGLELKFIGNYLDTLDYLQKLEALNSNFLWEDLTFSLDDYPKANVSFKIFTLSTQEGWIGV